MRTPGQGRWRTAAGGARARSPSTVSQLEMKTHPVCESCVVSHSNQGKSSLTWLPSVFNALSAAAASGLHGDEGGEVSCVVGEEEGALVAVGRVALQGKVDAAEGDRGEGLAVYVLKTLARLTSNNSI